jgi:rubrerythrin
MEAYRVTVDGAAVVEVSNPDHAAWYYEQLSGELKDESELFCQIETVEADPGIWTHGCGECGTLWADGLEIDSPSCPICGSTLVDGVAQN